jgi:hypothetical protein
MVARLGEDTYNELRALALSHQKVDLPELVARLREETRDLT